MSNDKKLVIDRSELRKITDASLRIFHEAKYLPDDPKDAQVFLIISGLASYLTSKGVTPQFEVKPVREEPTDGTIDDL